MCYYFDDFYSKYKRSVVELILDDVCLGALISWFYKIFFISLGCLVMLCLVKQGEWSVYWSSTWIKVDYGSCLFDLLFKWFSNIYSLKFSFVLLLFLSCVLGSLEFVFALSVWFEFKEIKKEALRKLNVN